MGAQQGKMPGQPPVGYQGSSLPPPPPPLPSARDGIGTNAPAQPRPVSKIKGLKPRQGQHHSTPRSPLASQSSIGSPLTGQTKPASPLTSNIFAEHNGKTAHFKRSFLRAIFSYRSKDTKYDNN